MKLYGSLTQNLEAAVASAVRLRETSVYPDTIEYWRALVSYSWRVLAERSQLQSASVADLTSELERELRARE